MASRAGAGGGAVGDGVIREFSRPGDPGGFAGPVDFGATVASLGGAIRAASCSVAGAGRPSRRSPSR